MYGKFYKKFKHVGIILEISKHLQNSNINMNISILKRLQENLGVRTFIIFGYFQNLNISSILHNEYGILIQNFNIETMQKIKSYKIFQMCTTIFLEPKYSVHFTNMYCIIIIHIYELGLHNYFYFCYSKFHLYLQFFAILQIS